MKYFLLYKPFGVICQFSPEEPGQRTLKELYPFPSDVYPVGRLDLDSEGLLILTNDARLNARLLHPNQKHQRTYLVQVEGIPTTDALNQLQQGVEIRVNKSSYRTLPAKVRLLPSAPALPDRNPPIRFRATIPTAWIEIQLIEGKNRQVRKMCAKVGFPVLRLIRSGIETLRLENMMPGDVRELDQLALYKGLNLGK